MRSHGNQGTNGGNMIWNKMMKRNVSLTTSGVETISSCYFVTKISCVVFSFKNILLYSSGTFPIRTLQLEDSLKCKCTGEIVICV